MNLQPSNPTMRAMRAGRTANASRPARRWIIWFVSIGIFLPYTFGDTGKYVIALLSLPALFAFISLSSKGRRRIMACDLFVWAAVTWMLLVKIGSSELFATASDALALFGSYMVARSFIYGEPAVREFIRALKIVALALVALSLLDTLTGTFFTVDLLGKFFQYPRAYGTAGLHRSLFGFDVLRATSTFGHPILFGSFCSVAAAIFLAGGGSIFQRIFYSGVCLLGCVLSVSSAPILGVVIVAVVVAYDRLLHSSPQRWTILFVLLAVAACLSFALSNNPLTWLLRNLTADPFDAYYRLLIWANATDYIALSPIVGTDPVAWSTNEILHTIDSVWLVLAMSYGLPMVALLLLASLSACGVSTRKLNLRLASAAIVRARTGFSLALFLFAYLGLTVHFWGGVWMFWGLCLGIRASLEDYCSARSLSTSSPRNLQPAFGGIGGHRHL